MIKGLYAAVSAMVVNATRQQTIAHNVANLDTPGFKQVLTTVDDFTDTGVVFSPGNILRSSLRKVGQLGLGSMYGPEYVDFNQGALETTNNPYDLAIEGNGMFRVQTPEGERYTRDGRFIRNSDNNLVTVEGFKVLDDGGQPIELPEGTFSVGRDGTIAVDGEEVGKIGLVSFKDPKTELKRDRGNLYTGPASATGEDNGVVVQGALEMSNANASFLMTQMVEVARSYEAAQKMVQNQDELVGKTISTLGRIG